MRSFLGVFLSITIGSFFYFSCKSAQNKHSVSSSLVSQGVQGAQKDRLSYDKEGWIGSDMFQVIVEKDASKSDAIKRIAKLLLVERYELNKNKLSEYVERLCKFPYFIKVVENGIKRVSPEGTSVSIFVLKKDDLKKKIDIVFSEFESVNRDLKFSRRNQIK